LEAMGWVYSYRRAGADIALSNPAVAALVGDAERVRFIHLPNMPGSIKAYVVYVALLTSQKKQFVFKEIESLLTDPAKELIAPMNDIAHNVIPNDEAVDIQNFYIIETNTNNNVLFLWDDGADIWKMVYDFQNLQTTVIPQVAFAGTHPVLARDWMLRAFYVVSRDLKLRNELTVPELDIVTHSAYRLLSFDIDDKSSDSFVYYIGNYDNKANIPLPLSTDAYTRILLDCTRETLGPGAHQTVDIIGGLVLTNTTPSLVHTGQPGQIGESWLFEYQSGWFSNWNIPLSAPLSFTDFSVSVWIYGGADQPVNSTIIYGRDASSNRVFEILLPWGSGTVYWRCGNSDTSSYDQLTYTGSASYYKGKWTHYLFTKSVSGGRMKIFRDNVQVASTTGKTRFLSDVDALWVVPRYSGYVAEVVFMDKEVVTSELANIYNRGLQGNRIDSSIVGGLEHYWTFDNYDARVIVDDSGNAYNAVINDEWSISDEGAIRIGDYPAQINQWDVGGPGAQITIEAWVTPKFISQLGYVVNGDIRFYYDLSGELHFEFDGASTHHLQQVALHTMRWNEPNHIVVSHTFGNSTNTFMAINGNPVPSQWMSGDGNEDPSFGLINTTIETGLYDILSQYKISFIAKTEAEIKDYITGRV